MTFNLCVSEKALQLRLTYLSLSQLLYYDVQTPPMDLYAIAIIYEIKSKFIYTFIISLQSCVCHVTPIAPVSYRQWQCKYISLDSSFYQREKTSSDTLLSFRRCEGTEIVVLNTLAIQNA